MEKNVLFQHNLGQQKFCCGKKKQVATERFVEATKIPKATK